MAKRTTGSEFKRTPTADVEAEDDRRRIEAEHTREQFGIETLTDDEELIDDETFSRMHDRLAIRRPGSGDEGSHGAASPDVSAETADELLLEEIVTVLPSEPAEARPDAGAPADAAAVALLERSLLEAKDRDEVCRTTLGIARYYAEASALFVVNNHLIAGLRGSGGGLEDRLEGVAVSTGAESVLSAAFSSGQLARAATPFGPIEQNVLRAMGREDVRHIAVLPIAIDARVVNLLYVDNGAAPLAETSLAALRVLGKAVGRVYRRLIVERKRSGAPARG